MTRPSEKLTLRKPKRSATTADTLDSSSELQPNAVIARSARPVTPEERHAFIAEAAYYLAERRCFEVGQELEDWLRAENQVHTRLASGALPVPPQSAP